jgi:hypothetical protein
MDVFASLDLEIGFPPCWNRDPKTGIEAPLEFGKTLQYRDDRIVGNIQYLWEPSRHANLVTLAQAWHLTNDTKYAEACKTLLDSWFQQCPYPFGPHWTSSLEHGIRLTNWAVAWHLLHQEGRFAPIFEGDEGDGFCQRWLKSIHQHCHFIAGHLSLHSSANNHLFGEYMGLFIGALNWPLWPESEGWLEAGYSGIADLALLQNFADGVNREHAIWYAHEVADMMLLCGLFGRANRREFDEVFWRQLEAMLEFFASLMDVGGNVPAIGDSDDAVMVRFSREPGFDVFRSLLATGAVLFKRGDFKRKAGKLDEKTRWLLGDAAAEIFERLPADGPLPVRHVFNQGGYFVLGGDFESQHEVRIVADIAPLGYLSIAAHGHADALAFALSAGGKPLLIDPGTYAYHTEKKWRDYFRGTAAHNTLQIDGVDQSVSGGNFMWTRHARARCETFEQSRGGASTRLVGSHDGYARLSQGVRHRREWLYERQSRCLRVTDSLEGLGQHMVAAHWHFDEACAVSMHDGFVEAAREGVLLRLHWPAGLSARIACGEESPPLGWVSRVFDDKQPTKTLLVSGDVAAGWVGETRFEIIFL